jgi:hypothetical protein
VFEKGSTPASEQKLIPAYLRPREAAEFLGISPSLLAKEVVSGVDDAAFDPNHDGMCTILGGQLG